VGARDANAERHERRVQDEDWDLDYRAAQGWNMFVVEDEAQWLNSDVPACRSSHEQIEARCPPVAVIRTTRLFFFETEVRI